MPDLIGSSREEDDSGGSGGDDIATTLSASTQALNAANLASAAFVNFQETIQMILATVNPQVRMDSMNKMLIDVQTDLRHLRYELGLYSVNIKPLDGDIDRPPKSGNQE